MKANEERRKFKEFLETTVSEQKKPFDNVVNYWTKDSGHPTAIWNIIEPIRTNDDEEKEMIGKMRLLIADLNHVLFHNDGDNDTAKSPLSSCCQNEKHKHCVTVEEALLIVCLASVSEKERRNLVLNAPSSQDALVREELLKEASLIASAIAMSDEFESSFQE